MRYLSRLRVDNYMARWCLHETEPQIVLEKILRRSLGGGCWALVSCLSESIGSSGVSSVFKVFPFCPLPQCMGTKQKETGGNAQEHLRKGWLTQGKQAAVNFSLILP